MSQLDPELVLLPLTTLLTCGPTCIRRSNLSGLEAAVRIGMSNSERTFLMTSLRLETVRMARVATACQ